MTSRALKIKYNRRYLILAAILLVLLYVVVPQLGDFQSSWHLLRHPDQAWLAAGILFTGLTYVAGAATYYSLAFRPLNYSQMLLVQLAAMFINRLLPAGLGAVGANYAYLRHARHQITQAASVVAINNLLGFFGHGLIIGITLLVYVGNPTIIKISSPRFVTTFLVVAVAGSVLLGGLLLAARGRPRHVMVETGRHLLSYRHRPLRLILALLCSMSLTLFNILSLACCAQAVGVHLPLVAVIFIFTFGIGAGTATPTPGGLGGFEAGLVAGLVAYHIASPIALSAALLYRLVSYWLPLLAGAPAFVLSQRRQLFNVS